MSKNITNSSSDRAIRGLLNTITDLETDLTDILTRLTAAENNIINIQTDITNINLDIGAIEGDIATIQADIISLEANLNVAQNNITVLQNAFSDLGYFTSNGVGNFVSNSSGATISVTWRAIKFNKVVTLTIYGATATMSNVNNWTSVFSLVTDIRPISTAVMPFIALVGPGAGVYDNDITASIAVNTSGNIILYRELGGGSVWNTTNCGWNCISISYPTV